MQPPPHDKAGGRAGVRLPPHPHPRHGRAPRGGGLFRWGAALRRNPPPPLPRRARSGLPPLSPPGAGLVSTPPSPQPSAHRAAGKGRGEGGRRGELADLSPGLSRGWGKRQVPAGSRVLSCGSNGDGGLSKRKHDAGGEGEGGGEISRGYRAALARRRPLPASARRARPRRGKVGRAAARPAPPRAGLPLRALACARFAADGAAVTSGGCGGRARGSAPPAARLRGRRRGRHAQSPRPSRQASPPRGGRRALLSPGRQVAKQPPNGGDCRQAEGTQTLSPARPAAARLAAQSGRASSTKAAGLRLGCPLLNRQELGEAKRLPPGPVRESDESHGETGKRTVGVQQKEEPKPITQGRAGAGAARPAGMAFPQSKWKEDAGIGNENTTRAVVCFLKVQGIADNWFCTKTI